MAPRVLNQDYEFFYQDVPTVMVVVRSAQSGIQQVLWAQLDTGSSFTILDIAFAERLQLDLSNAPRVVLQGATGRFEGRFAEVELQLLGQVELTVLVEVAFVPRLDVAEGNLLGLDLLEQIDLSLSHFQRRGFLGIASSS